jgi:hypothetical protein
MPAQAGPVQAVSTTAVISQVYGGGGNVGATYQNDYIELFNRGTLTVSLTGWSVQYTSATGTGNFGSTTNLITPLAGSLAPGQYLLVQEASTAAVGAPLPAPDVTDTTPINMSGTGGKVALVNTTTPLGCNGSSTPCSPAALATIVDRIGWDGADFFEGSGPGPATSNSAAALRVAGGCQDTDNNAADFMAGVPNPRNTASPLNPCPTDLPPAVISTSPTSGAGGVALDADVSVRFSEPVDVTGSWFTIGCGDSGGHGATASGGPTTFTLDPTVDFRGGETCTVTVLAASVSDQDTDDPPDTMAADYAFSFTTLLPLTAIPAIQGSAHRSPLAGSTVRTSGIVTARRANGFYLQDPAGDGIDATSDGLFVFTSSAPTVSVGDAVEVTATVSEFRQGGATSTNLTVTELTGPSITVISTGTPLPVAVVIGAGGRVPPDTVIEDDASGDVETSGVFDPASDGIDFYESLEGMRVRVNDAVAVGPWHDFGSNREVPIVVDDGANASLRTARGGIVVRAGDFNPERMILNDLIAGGPTLPTADVGDTFSGATLGVLDYSFGNFKLEVTSLPGEASGGLAREATTAAGTNEVSVGTFNVENLSPVDPPTKFATLARLIVSNLRNPDIIGIEEIQDNNGPTDNGVVDASTTWSMLIAAIQSAGGPAYDYRQIDPVNDQDGGQPGGNIRQGFLFRTDRGLSFVDRPGAGSTTANAVVGSGAATQLRYSPGRIDPTDGAFNASRKPLAGEFSFNGHHLFVVANHWNSKGGDQPLFGHFQPPTLVSEVQRQQQATIVHHFVQAILAADPAANVVVAGDLNDFEFSAPVTTLESAPLHDLVEMLPPPERYSYVFEGNSQTLDHILVSNAIFDTRPFAFDSVHVNAEFANQASDHDPQVVRIRLNDAPTASAGGPYAVVEGGSVVVSASGSDPEGGPLTYAWDLDDDGSFETPGQSVTFSAGTLVAPAVATVTVRVTDNGGLTDVASTTVQVQFPFAGFFSPVDNPPTFNVVKAGQIVPVRFSLNGDRGLAIFAAGYPTSFPIACPAAAQTDAVEEVVAASTTSLHFDAATGQYVYTWKTDRRWATTCRQLVLKLTDGTVHAANFAFTK